MLRILIATAAVALLLAGPAKAVVSLDDVIRMLEAGVGEEVILKVIDADESRFVIDSDDLIDLTQAGASDRFLEELLDRSRESGDLSDMESSYRVIEHPYVNYVSIGWVYDPFDYYFATWPYYYAWISPWHFHRPWWYYGGPCHLDWCAPVCYRADYYDRHWGTRTVWDRGYGDTRYHAPAYRADKDVRTAGFIDRGTTTRTGDRSVRNTHVWGRPSTDRRVRAEGSPARSSDRSTYDRSRPSRDAVSPRPSRAPEVRNNRSNDAPRASAPRISAPTRPSAPSRSSTPSRPSNPQPSGPSPNRPRR